VRTDSDTFLDLVSLLAGGCETAAELEQRFNVDDVLGLVHQGLQVAVFSHLCTNNSIFIVIKSI
jgi:hypothetical protein